MRQHSAAAYGAHASLVADEEVAPHPSTLNPQPSTLNPQPSTLNPQPWPLKVAYRRLATCETEGIFLRNEPYGIQLTPYLCRLSMAHIRQSRPDSVLGFQVNLIKHFKVFPFRSEADSKRQILEAYPVARQRTLKPRTWKQILGIVDAMLQDESAEWTRRHGNALAVHSPNQ